MWGWAVFRQEVDGNMGERIKAPGGENWQKKSGFGDEMEELLDKIKGWKSRLGIHNSHGMMCEWV